MNYQITINSANTVDEIETYWTNDDYIKLLEKFDYPDASDADASSLRELLFMAISDFEARDAAVVVLEYKLSEDLNEGQIQQISNDMFLDKVCEEYPEIGLHSTLFHINQLLFKAYNGTFPNAKATIIKCGFTPAEGENENELTKEKFQWQEEYFAVSVSESILDKVREYIKNQEEHHKKKSFQVIFWNKFFFIPKYFQYQLILFLFSLTLQVYHRPNPDLSA
mgnify:CR=1 FL=1